MKKTTIAPFIQVSYYKCNSCRNQFSLYDWTATRADVLWVAALLDNIPERIVFKMPSNPCKFLFHGVNLEKDGFIAAGAKLNLYEWEDLNSSPFLKRKGLQDLKVKIKANSKGLIFKFFVPVELKPNGHYKADGIW